MVVNPFEGLSKKTETIKVGDVEIKVKPTVKDLELFVTMKRDQITEEDAEKITKIMKNMIRRAYPEKNANGEYEVKDEDIEAFIMKHYGELMLQMTVVFGFNTEADLKKIKEDLEKKTISQ